MFQLVATCIFYVSPLGNMYLRSPGDGAQGPRAMTEAESLVHSPRGALAPQNPLDEIVVGHETIASDLGCNLRLGLWAGPWWGKRRPAFFGEVPHKPGPMDYG